MKRDKKENLIRIFSDIPDGGNVKTQLKITIYCDNIIKKTQ